MMESNSTNDTNGIINTDSTMEELGLGPFPERPMLERMFDFLHEDKYGNTPVTALAQVAQLRRTCRAWKKLAQRTTIYDAKILFDQDNDDETGMPVYFVGGASFGELPWFPALCIIRHPKNGRVFCVSVKRHLGFQASGRHYAGPMYTPEQCSDPKFGLDDELHRFEVNRIYKIGELAGLLNGHCADFDRRLPNLRKYQYGDWDYGDRETLRGRTLVPKLLDALPEGERDTNEEIYAFTPQKRVETNAQLVTRSVDSTWCSDGHLLTHHDDSITWGVEKITVTRTMDSGHVRHFNTFLETPTLVLIETDAQEPGAQEPLNGWPREAKYMPPSNAWAGPNQTALDVRGPLRDDTNDTAPHEPGTLRILLGQFSDGLQGTGAGWWPSIFLDHRCGELERAYYQKQNRHNNQTAAERALEIEAKTFPDWHCRATSDETLKKMGAVAMRAHKYTREVAPSSVDARLARGRPSRAAKRDAEIRIDRINSSKSDDNGRLIAAADRRMSQAEIDYDGQFAVIEDIPSFLKSKSQKKKDDPEYVQSKVCPFVSDEDEDEDEDEDRDEDEDDACDDSVEEIVEVAKKKKKKKKKKQQQPRTAPPPRAGGGASRKRKAADPDPFAAFASLL